MSADAMRRSLETARRHFNAGAIEPYLDSLYTDDCVLHYLPPGMPQGKAGGRLFYGAFLAAFPDAELRIDDVLVDGDRLVARYHVTATHQGEFNGLPPTGRRVRFTGITVMRFVGGLVAERWSESDFLGLMQQLGALPGGA